MLRNSPTTWGSVAKTLHWLMAALLLIQIALGWTAIRLPLSPTKLDVFVWHKSLGLTILGLALIRLAWRWANPIPRLPPATPRFQARAARSSHALLYLIMIAMPITGWVINSAAQIPFAFFWWLPVPDIAPESEALAATTKTVHFAFFLLLAVTATLHVTAAFYHHRIQGDDILRRMVPGQGESR